MRSSLIPLPRVCYKGRKVSHGFIILFLSLLVSHRPGTLHDFHSHEIAEQLTLLDAELFYKIEVQTQDQGLGQRGGEVLTNALMLFSNSS